MICITVRDILRLIEYLTKSLSEAEAQIMMNCLLSRRDDFVVSVYAEFD